jgi:hypothetical protein
MHAKRIQIRHCGDLAGTHSLCFDFLHLHKHRYAGPFPTECLSTLKNFLVGAALWAADIEANNVMMTEMTTPRINKEASKKAE